MSSSRGSDEDERKGRVHSVQRGVGPLTAVTNGSCYWNQQMGDYSAIMTRGSDNISFPQDDASTATPALHLVHQDSFSFLSFLPLPHLPSPKPCPQGSEMHPAGKWAFSSGLGNLTGKCLCFLKPGITGCSGPTRRRRRSVRSPAGTDTKATKPFPGAGWTRALSTYMTTLLWSYPLCISCYTLNCDKNETWAIFIQSPDELLIGSVLEESKSVNFITKHF